MQGQLYLKAMQPVMHELADGEYYQDFYIHYAIRVYNTLFGEKKERTTYY